MRFPCRVYTCANTLSGQGLGLDPDADLLAWDGLGVRIDPRPEIVFKADAIRVLVEVPAVGKGRAPDRLARVHQPHDRQRRDRPTVRPHPRGCRRGVVAPHRLRSAVRAARDCQHRHDEGREENLQRLCHGSDPIRWVLTKTVHMCGCRQHGVLPLATHVGRFRCGQPPAVSGWPWGSSFPICSSSRMLGTTSWMLVSGSRPSRMQSRKSRCSAATPSSSCP